MEMRRLRLWCAERAPRLFLRLARPDKDELGRIGEELAARELAGRGWRILGRRLATPVGEVDVVAGLVSPDGGMWRTTDETVEHASAEEVERELRAQIEKALAAGIDVTHVDGHMGTVFNPKFVHVYLALAREFRLPMFLPRVSREVLERTGMPPSLESYVELIEDAERDGFPIFDQFCADSLEFPPGTGSAHNQQRVNNLGTGLSYLITHCARGGPELESITHDWRQRDEEHRIYSDGTMSAFFAAQGIKTIGMRPLRDHLRERLH